MGIHLVPFGIIMVLILMDMLTIPAFSGTCAMKTLPMNGTEGMEILVVFNQGNKYF